MNSRTVAFISVYAAAIALHAVPAQARQRGMARLFYAGQPAQHQGSLAPRFRDAAGGFVLRPPRNTTSVEQPGLNLATFVNKKRRWGVYVRLSPLRKDIPVGPMLKAMAARLRHFQAVQLYESRKSIIGGKPAGIQVASFKITSNAQGLAILRQQAIVQVSPREYYVLTFFSPLEDRHRAEHVFRGMLKTFHLLNRKKIAARRRAALKAGLAWLKRHPAEQLKRRLVKQPQLFQIYVGGRGTGYLMITESTHASHTRVADAGYRGVLVEADSRTFPPNGGELKSQNLAFWAFRHQPNQQHVDYDSWSSRMESLEVNKTVRYSEQVVMDPIHHKYKLIKKKMPPLIFHWATELGTQQTAMFPKLSSKGKPTGEYLHQTRLSVARTSDHANVHGPGRMQRYPIPASVPVLPPTLNYLWPRLVNLTRPQTMSFFVYNSSQGRLGLRTLRVLGPQSITLRGHQQVAYHLEDTLDPGRTDLWVNSRGRILVMRTNDGTLLLPTTAAAMHRKWGARLDAIRRYEAESR